MTHDEWIDAIISAMSYRLDQYEKYRDNADLMRYDGLKEFLIYLWHRDKVVFSEDHANRIDANIERAKKLIVYGGATS